MIISIKSFKTVLTLASTGLLAVSATGCETSYHGKYRETHVYRDHGGRHHGGRGSVAVYEEEYDDYYDYPEESSYSAYLSYDGDDMAWEISSWKEPHYARRIRDEHIRLVVERYNMMLVVELDRVGHRPAARRRLIDRYRFEMEQELRTWRQHEFVRLRHDYNEQRFRGRRGQRREAWLSQVLDGIHQGEQQRRRRSHLEENVAHRADRESSDHRRDGRRYRDRDESERVYSEGRVRRYRDQERDPAIQIEQEGRRRDHRRNRNQSELERSRERRREDREAHLAQNDRQDENMPESAWRYRERQREQDQRDGKRYRDRRGARVSSSVRS